MPQETQQMDEQLLTVKNMLTALDLPIGDEFAESMAGSDVWRQASRIFTDSMAEECWLKWNPKKKRRIKDPRFLGYFKEFLANGLELGYRLDRFREVSGRLPDPDDGARNWIEFFEEIVSGDDCCAVRLYLSREQLEAFRTSHQEGSGGGQTWEDMLGMVTDGLFYELGLVFRPVTVSVDDALTTPWFRCEWNDFRLPPQCGLDVQHILVNDQVDRLILLNIKGERAINPANGSECAFIDSSYRSIAEQAGLTAWDSRGYTILALSAAIRHAAAALVNRQLYQIYIMHLRENQPDLISAVESTMERDFIVQILRGLLAEGISVRNLSAILEAVLELRSTINVDMGKHIVFEPPTGGVFPDPNRRATSELLPEDYVEFVRTRLKRCVSHKYTRGGSTLVVYLMDPNCEKILARPDELDADARTAILEAVRDEIGTLPPTAQNPVILTTMEVRRRLHKLVSLDFPDLAVLSYQELSPNLNIQPIARISPDFSVRASSKLSVHPA